VSPDIRAAIETALSRMDEAEAHNRRLGEEARKLRSGEGVQRWARYDALADCFKICAEWTRAALDALAAQSEPASVEPVSQYASGANPEHWAIPPKQLGRAIHEVYCHQNAPKAAE
jgi:hypothetical protein